VSARDAARAHAVLGLAEETWRLLAGPLTLPERFPSPVFVRVIESSASAPGGSAMIEPGGVVSLRIRWPEAAPLDRRAVREALIRALLLRVGVAWHGAGHTLTVPDWLERGAAEWCVTRAEPARLDAWKREAAGIEVPSLAAVLLPASEESGSRAFAVLSLGLFTVVQSEATRATEWPLFLRTVLAGEPALRAFSSSFPGRFASAEERELWWQTGWHHVRRARTLPGLDAEESRREIARLARFVVMQGDTERVLTLRGALAHGQPRWLQDDLNQRVAELTRIAGALHPFFRNAGLSLAEAFRAAGTSAAKQEVVCQQFESDWRDARELQVATRAALDRLEQRR
jgi:hypothetical protein